MTARQTSLRTDAPFDDLRRSVVSDPRRPGAYGQLAAQHYGAFAAARLRPMLRWIRVLVGANPVVERLDGIFARLERAEAARLAGLGAAASTHEVSIRGRPVCFVTDDPASDRFVRRNLIERWPYEAGVVGYVLARLRRDDVFVDVGAHAGFFSLIAAAFGAVAYAIEPQRDLVRVIERNAAVNGADRIHVLALAVSDHEGLSCQLRLGGSPGMQLHGELDRPAHPTPQNRHADWVPVVRLDSLFDDDVVRPRLVKIDVEGLELRALGGSAGLLARGETAFAVEIHPHLIADFGGDLASLGTLFGSSAWRVYDISSDPPEPVDLAEGIARAARGTRADDGRVTLAFEPVQWAAL